MGDQQQGVEQAGVDDGADNWAGIATRAENTEVIAFLNQELTRLKADGTLNQLQEKWFGFRMTLADKIPDFSS